MGIQFLLQLPLGARARPRRAKLLALVAGPAMWAVAGAIGFHALKPAAGPVVYPHVIVTTRVIEAHEPDTVVRFRERIVTRIVQPDQVATAVGGAAAEVAAFCRADTVIRVDAIPSGIIDTVCIAPEPRLLLRSVTTDPGYFFRPDRIVLSGPLSTGDLEQRRYTVRPGWSARTSADSLIVRSPRWQFVKEVLEAAGLLFLGYELGKLR